MTPQSEQHCRFLSFSARGWIRISSPWRRISAGAGSGERPRGGPLLIIDRIFQLFSKGGHATYFGEAVPQTEHALQSAHLAASAGAGSSLIVAALLHDVGHLLHGLPENIAEQ